MLRKFNLLLTAGLTVVALGAVWASGALSMPTIALAEHTDADLCVGQPNAQLHKPVLIPISSLVRDINHMHNKTALNNPTPHGVGMMRRSFKH